jgi:hypothetical protein
VLCAGILLCWIREAWSVALPQIALFGCGAAMLFADAREDRRWEMDRIAWLLCSAAAWGGLQLIAGTTVYRHATATWTIAWLANVTAYVLARRLGSPAVRDALMGFGAVVAAAGTVLSFAAPGKVFGLFESGYRDMVIGPFVYHNQFAAFVELLFPVALWGALTGGQRFLHAIAAAFLFGAAVASGSRMGAGLVTLELVAMLALAAGRDWRAVAGPAVLVIAALAVAVAAIGPDVLARRIGSEFSGGRIEYWKSSVAMVTGYPWLGVGLGNWPLVYPAYALFDDGLIANQAHSEWVEWACEGSAPFVAFLLTIAFTSLRPAAVTRWGIGVIAFWIHCAVDYPTRRPAIAVFFFAFLGVVTALQDRSAGKYNRPDS